MCSTNKSNIRKKFINIDREKYGTIDNITNKDSYSNDIIPELENLDESEKLKINNDLKLLEYDGIFYYYSIDKNIKNLKEVLDI